MRLSRGLRERCEQLHHSGALKDLLDEFALWTALWTGFPLTNELNLRKRALPAPSGPRIGQAAGSSMNDEMSGTAQGQVPANRLFLEMERTGIEPVTSGLQSRRSPS
jgi:hypothetical protein